MPPSCRPGLYRTSHTPFTQAAVLFMHASIKHCTPGPLHLGSDSPFASARQSQAVQ